MSRSQSQTRKKKADGKRDTNRPSGKSDVEGHSSPTAASQSIERFLTREAEKESDPPKGIEDTGPRPKVKGCVATPVSVTKTEERELRQPPTRTKPRPPARPPKATGQRGRKKKKPSSVKESDEDYPPTSGRRRVQQSIKDLFPVRRSTRRSKSLLESEEFEDLAQRLRDKDEDGLAVVDVEGKGRGVVSTRPYRSGELVCEYSGELIPHREAQEREQQYSQDDAIGCYMYYFVFKGKKLCVDATRDNGRLGRLLNHSKTSANVVTRLVEVDSRPYLCLMAARDIAVGEELQYDYGERSREAIESHPWLAT